MIVVHGEMEVAADRAADVDAAGAVFAEKNRAEEGCIDYQLAWKFGSPTVLRLLEVWDSMEAYQTHVAQPHVKEWSEWIPAAAAGPLVTQKHNATPVDPSGF